MRVIEIQELCKKDYSVNVINGIKQYWKHTDIFNCIHKPKKINMLNYLDGVDVVYKLKDGRIIHAYSGEVVYTPVNAEYEFRVVHKHSDEGNTIGINLYFYDENNQPFILSNDIVIFHDEDRIYKLLFQKVDSYSECTEVNYGRMKAGVYDILSELSEQRSRKNFDKYRMIAKGIMCIEQENRDYSIREIAELCNVSEAYFYKLFKSYSGVSPVKYRIDSKIAKAKIYLEYEELSVAEIAERLTFGSPTYFIKVFKKYTGMTPLEWKKNKKDKNVNYI